MNASDFDRWLLDPRRSALVMGILNVTPDSFSDGGSFFDALAAVAQIPQIIADGADIIDIGAESTKPGAQRVDEKEQIRRLQAVLGNIYEVTRESQARSGSSAIFSIDTTRAAVAGFAIDHGVSVINDISAGRDDPAMFALAAKRNVPIILMHMQGEPATMQANPHYTDVVREVREFLLQRAAAAEAAGIPAHHILIDPGLGFGKTLEHNIALMKNLREFTQLKYPLVLGPSRKGFLGKIINEPDPMHRTYATAAAIAWAVTNQSAIVRVHDVKEMAQVVRTICAFL